MYDLVNEPDNKRIFWAARDGRPSLAKLYLDAMDAITKAHPDAVFVLEVRPCRRCIVRLRSGPLAFRVRATGCCAHPRSRDPDQPLSSIPSTPPTPPPCRAPARSATASPVATAS
jgi:hypothetical protein